MPNPNPPTLFFLVLLVVFVVIVSCQPTPVDNHYHPKTTQQPDKTEPAIAIDTTAFDWHFETKEDVSGTPNTTIYLIYKGVKYKASRGIGEFQKLPRTEFEQPHYSVPKKAITAAQGYWAGLLQIYYAATENNQIVVYKRTTDAEAPEPETPVFELVMHLDAASTVKKE